MDEDTAPANTNPVEFWLKRKESHPILSKVAARYIYMNCSVQEKWKVVQSTFINVEKSLLEPYLFLSFMSDYFWSV